MFRTGNAWVADWMSKWCTVEFVDEKMKSVTVNFSKFMAQLSGSPGKTSLG